MMRKWAIWGMVLTLAAVLAACGTSGAPAGQTTPAKSDAGASAAPSMAASTAPTTAPSAGMPDAEAIAKANCISCHGADLAGKIGPNLQKIGAKLSRDQIKNQITNGGGGMPSMKSKLKPEEIDALADWLAAKK